MWACLKIGRPLESAVPLGWGVKKSTPQRVPKDTLECGGSYLLIPGTFCLGRPDPVRVPVSGCFGMDTKFESTHFPCFPHIYYLETNPRGCRGASLGDHPASNLRKEMDNLGRLA